MFDADDLSVLVIAPAGAEFDEVEAAVRPEFHVHGTFEGHFRTEAFHPGDAIVGVEVDGDDPVPGPFVNEKGMIELGGEFGWGLEVFIEVVNRTCHGGATATAIDDRKFGGDSVSVIDEGTAPRGARLSCRCYWENYWSGGAGGTLKVFDLEAKSQCQ